MEHNTDLKTTLLISNTLEYFKSGISVQRKTIEENYYVIDKFLS